MKKFIVFILLVAGGVWGYKHFGKPKAEEKQNTTAPVKEFQGNVELLDHDKLTDGIHLYQQKKFEQAIEQLKKEYGDPEKAAIRDRSLAYVAKSYQYLNDLEKAEKYWDMLAINFPNSRYIGDAKYFLAQQKQKAGLYESANNLLNEASLFPQSLGGSNASLDLARIYKKKENSIPKVWEMYSRVLRFSSDEKALQEAMKEVNQIADSQVFSMLKTDQCEFYSVQSGDNLTKIAKKYNSSVGFIQKINGKKDAFLRIGERLKIIPGELSIEVRKKHFLLGIYLNDLCIRAYIVGLGRDDRTPIHTFVITTKQEQPTWWKDGRRIPYGHPDNLLGDYWLGFDNKPDAQGFGIHGTKDPSSIGKNMSSGCIRLHQEELKEVFTLIPRGTKVHIRKW